MSAISQWLESIPTSNSAPDYHCRSDIHIDHSTSELISKTLTESEPLMEYSKNVEGYSLPRTPASAGARFYAQSSEPSDVPSRPSSSVQSSARNLVENPFYRSTNLASNYIFLRSRRHELPEHISGLVCRVSRDRASPGPSTEDLWQDEGLEALEMGAAENDVQLYFQSEIFPRSSCCLKRSDRFPMSKSVVPQITSGLKLSTPVPDILYGYDRNGAFAGQQSQLISMGLGMTGNSQDLIYPFLVIEFKGDGPSGAGSLWAATNQCLGGSTSCVNITERLNHLLRQRNSGEILPIDSAAFSIAMNGTEARLFISWKNDEVGYDMARIGSFLLQRPDDYLAFRKWVRNIIDWGRKERLIQIQQSLDILFHQSTGTS